MKNLLLKTSLLLSTLLTIQAANAATINWGPATNITDDTNVSEDGSLIYAYNFGNPAVSPVVNGTTFTGRNIGGSWLNFPTAFGFNAAPFDLLSSNYQSLLRSGSNFVTAGTTSYGFSDLTVGQEYQVQFWVNDSRGAVTTRSTIFDGVVTLRANTTEMDGGLGQFVTGSWIADGPAQTITLSGPDTAITLNAVRFAAVPEPQTFVLLGLAGVSLLVRMKRRSQASLK